MTTYDPGDVVLIRFPFTDLSSSKKRPALVVSPASYQSSHGDVVVLALTSQRNRDRSLQLQNWKTAGLPKRTWCKPVVGTLASAIVVRRLGRIDAADYDRVKAALGRMIAPTFTP